MLSTSAPASFLVDGQTVDIGMHPDARLIRAVIISLFTWRRALPDDVLPGADRCGWWGDTWPDVPGDKIGSRLWLLGRSTLTVRTVELATEYGTEGLQWLVADGVATRADAVAVRTGTTALGLTVSIYRSAGGSPLVLRFADVWSALNV